MVAFNHSKKTTKGFTIIELVIVIVIIGILTAISFVVYNGITNRAKRVAMEAEADKLTKKLAIYRADNDTYPKSLKTKECNDLDESELCFESDYYIEYDLIDYGDDDPTNDDYWFEIWPIDEEDGEKDDEEDGDDDSKPCKEEHCGGGVIVVDNKILDGLPEHCPEGFIPVPGSAFYKQPGFCVMKYEASNLNGKAVSRYDFPSWGSVTNNQARGYAQTACSGCKLMTLSQWMTLARDIIQVDKNWTGGKMLNGTLYGGFTTLEYASGTSRPPLLKSQNDEDGYFGVNWTGSGGTTTVEGDDGEPIEIPAYDPRRTFYLSNGEVIWDLAGHFAEQIDLVVGVDAIPQCSDNNTFCNWENVTISNSIKPNPSPLATGILTQKNIVNQNSFVVGGVDRKQDGSSKSVAMGAMRYVGGGSLFGAWFILSPEEVFIGNPLSSMPTPYLLSIINDLDGVAPIGFRATLE